MTNMKPTIIVMLVCCRMLLARSVADPAVDDANKEASPAIITAECQIVTLPQNAALKVLPDLVDDAKVDAGFARLQSMIETGDAELVANLVLKTQDGKEASAQAAEEMRYPTEFDPPVLPQQIPKGDAAAILKNWPIIGFTPTAFETRELGPRIELKPVSVSPDGRSAEITVTAEDVRFLRWDRFDAGRLPTGDTLFIEQPQFHAITNTSTLRLQNGQRILFGAHKIPGEKGMMELFLLRVSVSNPR
jgi:hypothetical protein